MDDPRHAPLYSIPECARYLGLPASTVRRWLGKPGSDRKAAGKPLIIPAGSDPTALSFTNLVEIFVLSSLNRNRKAESQSPAGNITAKHDDGQSLVKRQLSGANFCFKRVEHDAAGMPIRFYPFTRGYGHEDPQLVVIDPAVSFGRPVIAGSGVRTSVVARRIKGGEQVADVADDYLLDQSQIEEAVRYELAV
ncbi:MAG: DUF433 domain-containing protein [Chloroflexota bacterium]|nr:DUF433 domain-containing protein [Chloroflexota bacterium]MDE2960750.1 DUF433 domain-containing protein [Chloroflexota bacterium]